MDKYENEIEILKEHVNNLENEISKLRLKLCIKYMMNLKDGKLTTNSAVRLLTPIVIYLVPTGKLPILSDTITKFIYEEFKSWLIGEHPQAKNKFNLGEQENMEYYKDHQDYYDYIITVLNNLKGDTDICEY